MERIRWAMEVARLAWRLFSDLKREFEPDIAFYQACRGLCERLETEAPDTAEAAGYEVAMRVFRNLKDTHQGHCEVFK